MALHNTVWDGRVLHDMPAAYFTSTQSASGALRSVITVPAQEWPVFLHKVRITASEAVETCIYNTGGTIVTPITSGSTEVAGINYEPGDQNDPSNVVLYQSFVGYRGNTNMGLLGTPGYLETSSAAGVLESVPDGLIIPPYCGLAVATTAVNRALSLRCHGQEIRFRYVVMDGYPVPLELILGRR